MEETGKEALGNFYRRHKNIQREERKGKCLLESQRQRNAKTNLERTFLEESNLSDLSRNQTRCELSKLVSPSF